MRIIFRKLSDQRHTLEIVRPNQQREHVECETRSYLLHDLLHYALESEAKLQDGFWGTLAGGTSLAEMNDRTRPAAEPMAAIEQVVGALSGTLKGRSDAELVAGMFSFAAAVGASMPEWLNEGLVAAVRERMRRLVGRWRATPYGGSMDLDWTG